MDSDVVQIHITMNQSDGAVYRVDFDFNTKTDDIDAVVSELIQHMKLSPEQQIGLKQEISKQIYLATPIRKIQCSDDEEIDDPEYKHLLEEQKIEREKLEALHLEEQKQLLAKLAPPQSTPQSDDLLLFN